jgi:hypothetical protein
MCVHSVCPLLASAAQHDHSSWVCSELQQSGMCAALLFALLVCVMVHAGHSRDSTRGHGATVCWHANSHVKKRTEVCLCWLCMPPCLRELVERMLKC